MLWEPRIDNVKVTVSAVPPHGEVNIEVRYRVRLQPSPPNG